MFENRVVASFLRGIPGLEAWAMLGKAFFHTKEMDGAQKRYDLVLLDAPATGHALDMLRVPQVLTDVAPPGLLRREAEDAMALFRDRERAGAVLVTLPEDMPTNETIELHAALSDELRIPTQRLVVNGVLPQLFPDSTASRLADAEGQLPPESPLMSLLEAGRIRAVREALQRETIARLAAVVSRSEYGASLPLRTRVPAQRGRVFVLRVLVP